MPIIARVRTLLKRLRHPAQADRDLDAELRAYEDALADEYAADGATPADARRRAAVALGGREAVKEAVRDVRTGAWAATFVRDMRHGARLLARSPWFAITASLSLAIGIGAVTAVFSLANGLLFRPATGVADPGTLVDVVALPRGKFVGVLPLPLSHYEAVRDRTSTVRDVYAYALEPVEAALAFDGRTERCFTGAVSANYFEALGVSVVPGRSLAGGRGEGVPAVVLGHDFWMRRFNGDPTVVGRQAFLNGRPFAIAGVARGGFRGTSVAAPDVWIGIDDADSGADPQQSRFLIGGRIAAGVSLEQASVEIATIGMALEPAGREPALAWQVVSASPVPFAMRPIAALFLAVLLTLVAIVLLIVTANVAGVLVARSFARTREIAVRAALGASRSRIVRQLLAEIVVLFGLGAAGGLIVAQALIGLLLRLLPVFPVPVHVPAPLDGRVVLFAMATGLGAAILGGLAPARRAARADIVAALKGVAAAGPDQRRLRHLFVVSQVALSATLVVVSGLLVGRLVRVDRADPGFEREGIVAATSRWWSSAGGDAAAAVRSAAAIMERIGQLPGVTSVTAADQPPTRPRAARVARELRGPGGPAPEPVVVPNVHAIAPGYFRTLGIPVLQGREFGVADSSTGAPVVIISARTAAMYWRDGDAIGRRLPDTGARLHDGSRVSSPMTVVGVVRDLAYRGAGPPPADLYVPLAQMPSPALTILVRSDDSSQTMRAIGALMAETEPSLPPPSVQPLEAMMDGPVEVQLRIATLVSATVGLVGLLLAVIGVHGVTAALVAERRQEFGVRLALGASRPAMVGIALGQGLKLVSAGLVVGLPLGAAAGALVGRSPLGALPLSPSVFVAATFVFLCAGLAACYLPARYAGRIDPVTLLKTE